ncbi:unnamed protein product, partial [Hapterophycus canaliculatus]
SPRASESNERHSGRDSGGRSAGGFAPRDKVEARYRGRGTKFYKGKVARVNSDGTLDVDYDDGEKEIGIAAEHVRTLDSAKSPDKERARAKPAELMEGDRVEADFRGRGRYYPGRISRAHRDGTYDVAYDDGEKERGIGSGLIRASERGDAGADEGRSGVRSRMQRGDRVEARYRGRGTKFYKGKVARVNSDGTLDVDYDDGEKEIGIAAEHVRPLDSSNGPIDGRDRGTTVGLLEGDRVEADFRGRGRYYPGRVTRIHRDGTIDVDYDDGEKETRVASIHVRSQRNGESHSKSRNG